MNRVCISCLSAILFVLIGVNEAFSQNNEEVSGTVTTAETGESLPGVNIRIMGRQRVQRRMQGLSSGRSLHTV